jgi:hypothetical protein
MFDRAKTNGAELRQQPSASFRGEDSALISAKAATHDVRGRAGLAGVYEQGAPLNLGRPEVADFVSHLVHRDRASPFDVEGVGEIPEISWQGYAP